MRSIALKIALRLIFGKCFSMNPRRYYAHGGDGEAEIAVS